MPGGDGTGPRGMGSMTGRGAGYCAGYPTPGYMNPVAGRGFGFGRGWGGGRGWGRGRGFGRGFGRGWGAYPYAPNSAAYPSYNAELTAKEEADMLRGQARAME